MMKCILSVARLCSSVILTVFVLGTTAFAEEPCIYPDGDSVRQVRSIAQVPTQFRSLARCFRAGQDAYLARPQDIQMSGSLRSEDIVSPVGRIRLRWPRKIESVFGRTPLRAMTEAASTVGRTLRGAGFPSSLQNLNLEWEVVFLDADLPDTQIPAYLIRNCHPGWMTPPANIYIVAQRVAGQCRPGDRAVNVADKQLARVLLHEMGHATEYYLLRGNQLGDRERAEGYATWFEGYSARFSSLLSGRAVEREHLELVRNSMMRGGQGQVFKGSAEDYARASLPFTIIVDRRGVASLMRVYELMARENLPFKVAVEKELSWNEKRLQQEVAKYIGLPEQKPGK